MTQHYSTRNFILINLDLIVFFLLHCYDVSLLIHAWCGPALYLHIRCFDSQGKFTLIKVLFFNLEDMMTESSCKLNTLCLTFLLCLIMFSSLFLSSHWFLPVSLPINLVLLLHRQPKSTVPTYSDPPRSTSNRESADLWALISHLRQKFSPICEHVIASRPHQCSVCHLQTLHPVLCFLLLQFIFLSCVNSY